jgi:hypothetical protein
VIALHRGGGLDRLWVEQAPDHDLAAVLSRAGIRPADLIRDPHAIWTQANVVDPAESVKIFRGDRGGHSDARMLPAGANPYSASVPFAGKENDMIECYKLLW